MAKKVSKTSRASTRGKRVVEYNHINSAGEIVSRVLFVKNSKRRFMWMNEAGDLFENSEVTLKRNI